MYISSALMTIISQNPKIELNELFIRLKSQVKDLNFLDINPYELKRLFQEKNRIIKDKKIRREWIHVIIDNHPEKSSGDIYNKLFTHAKDEGRESELDRSEDVKIIEEYMNERKDEKNKKMVYDFLDLKLAPENNTEEPPDMEKIEKEAELKLKTKLLKTDKSLADLTSEYKIDYASKIFKEKILAKIPKDQAKKELDMELRKKKIIIAPGDLARILDKYSEYGKRMIEATKVFRQIKGDFGKRIKNFKRIAYQFDIDPEDVKLIIRNEEKLEEEVEKRRMQEETKRKEKQKEQQEIEKAVFEILNQQRKRNPNVSFVQIINQTMQLLPLNPGEKAQFLKIVNKYIRSQPFDIQKKIVKDIRELKKQPKAPPKGKKL